MASSALEEKINKIRQQNEEIRRRHEEVEEDKKNAAKLNALVQMVPSSDWPERKEPPEFSNPPKAKQKPAKEKQEYIPQSHPVEGKKIHSFAQGEGPPPDPKYNFLADSEREEPTMEHSKETSANRYHNKVIRGNFKKKTGGRESIQKDNKVYKGNYRDESQPGYDAWRAERNRIDEDRISRQRTAEGNWRREWDNDKMHIIDDATKKTTRPVLADFTKRDHKDSDRRYYTNNNEYANHTRGGSRGSHRGSSKNFYGNYENRSHNTYDQHRNNTAMPAKIPLSPTSEGRTVIATDKSIKVTVNQNSASKGPMMSVKVNSPSIVGTGRVGPRQRSRVTYSSQSDAESPMFEAEHFFRQKSFEDKSKGTYFNNQKSPNVKRSQSLRKKDSESKYPYHQRKDVKKEDDDNAQRYHEGEFRSSAQKSFSAKSPKPVRRILHTTKQDSPSENTSRKHETQECIDQDSKNNLVTEDNAVPQISKSVLPSDQIETLNTESAEQSAENGITNEITLEKEMEKLSLSPLSGIENPGEMTEDNTNINSFESKTDCSQLLVNNIIEDLQENNTSSEASVPSNVESKEELVPNESNNVSNDIVKLEEASSSKDNQQLLEQVSEQLVPNESDNVADDIVKLEKADSSKDDQKTLEQVNEELVHNESNNVSDGIVELESAPLRNDNQQSSEEVSKQVANDNCDNIKDEVTEQRSALTTIDQAAPSLAIETHTVIEVKNQSACNDESIKETSVMSERTDEGIDCSDQNSKDTANCREVNRENIINGVSVDGNSIKKNEKTEEVKDVEEL